MERAQEDVRVLGDEQDAVSINAAAFAMIGVLAGLMAFFVTFAPVPEPDRRLPPGRPARERPPRCRRRRLGGRRAYGVARVTRPRVGSAARTRQRLPRTIPRLLGNRPETHSVRPGGAVADMSGGAESGPQTDDQGADEDGNHRTPGGG